MDTEPQPKPFIGRKKERLLGECNVEKYSILCSDSQSSEAENGITQGNPSLEKKVQRSNISAII